MQKILFVCAMKKEAIDITEKLNMKITNIDENNINLPVYTNETQSLIITGIGKQKTAIGLTKYLSKISKDKKPDLVINVGYAGSTDLPIGTWVNITKSYNYEWLIPGEQQYSMIDFGNQDLVQLENDNIKKVECYSAESFVTNTNLEGHNAFDMELHSIALICDMENIPLMSLKKISDNLSLDKYYETTENKDIMELTSCLELLTPQSRTEN